MVDLEWYRSFVMVYRCGTVSAAAQLLHLTQPAVSQHVSLLEKQMKAQLFHRAARQMVPTNFGKSLYSQVAPSIESLEAVAGFTNVLPQQTIHIGTPHEAFFSSNLNNLKTLDKYKLVFHFGLTADLIDELADERLDVVIATQKLAKSTIEYLKILDETFLVVGPQNFDRKLIRNKSNEMVGRILNTLPWIAYGEELPIIRRFWRQAFGERTAIKPKMIIPDLRAILNCIEAGLGFSVLPDYLCNESLKRKSISLVYKHDKPVTNEIWLAYRKSDRQNPIITALSESLSK